MGTSRSFVSGLGSLIVLLAAAAPGFATSPAARDAVGPARSTPGVEAAVVIPRINRGVPRRLRSTLESGFKLAVQKLSQEPECRDLFTALGANGLEILSTTFYGQASLKMEKQVCPRAFGFTVVGGAPTWVCQQFARLNDRRAAKVLLHEALHHAGMDEWPHDPDGLPPAAIDDLVEEACGF